MSDAPDAIEIVILTKPVPKGRPKFSFRSGHAYTPTKTRNAENLIALEIKRQFKGKAREGGVKLQLMFIYKTPATMKHQIGKPKMTKPDLDNLIKLFCDAANEILWVDDNQIYSVCAIKAWGEHDEIRARIYFD